MNHSALAARSELIGDRLELASLQLYARENFKRERNYRKVNKAAPEWVYHVREASGR